jgi:hypothetical protein
LEIKQVACVPYSHVGKIEIANKNVNHTNISKTDEKDVYEFIAKKNELIRSTIIPKIINQRIDKRDTVKNQLQKR